MFGCSGIKSSIRSIYFSWYGSDSHFTTEKQLDQPGHFLLPADDRVWVTTWVNAQTFLTHFRRNIEKWYTVVLYRRLQPSYSRKRTSTFSIGYELSPCKNGWFNIKILWAGRIFTSKRPIATMSYWPGSLFPARRFSGWCAIEFPALCALIHQEQEQEFPAVIEFVPRVSVWCY